MALSLPGTSGLLAPSHPDPSILRPTQDSGLRTVDLASFVPDYSGVAVPDFHGVPFGFKPPERESIFNYLLPQFRRGCQLQADRRINLPKRGLERHTIQSEDSL